MSTKTKTNNKVKLVGIIHDYPEFKEVLGNPFCQFTLEVIEKITNSNGQIEHWQQWFPIIINGIKAKTVSERLTINDVVIVRGRLSSIQKIEALSVKISTKYVF